MARTEITSDSPLADPKTLEQIALAICVLFKKHIVKMDKAIEESDDKQLTIHLPIDINCKELMPTIKVGLRFTPSIITDCRVIQCDTKQGTLAIFTTEELEIKQAIEAEEAMAKVVTDAVDKPVKRGRKSKKAADAEPTEAPPEAA